MSTFDRIMLVLVAVVVLPALLVPGALAVAAVLAASVLVLGYGGRFAADLFKKQHMGSRSGARQSGFRDVLNGSQNSQDDDWGRK